MSSTAKRLGKRVIGYPEHIVPTISSKQWVRGLKADPKRRVRIYSLFSRFIFFDNARLGNRLPAQFVSYTRMDIQI